jgi:beta-mannosidase
VLPEVVTAHDPDHSYWPSSPSSNLEAPAQDQDMGDVHYWDVWHGEQPFSAFTDQYPRFMSEYGFQSFPLMSSVERFTEPGDRELETPVMLAHQKNPRGNQLIRTYMQREYPEPLDFASFVYVSQVQQAEGMRIAAEHLRRIMPRSMGSLYWQIDDCWPVASWSGIDYYGTPKALQRYARRFYAPVLVSPVIGEDTVSVWVVSDRREASTFRLILRLLGLDGADRSVTERRVEIQPVTSGEVLVLDRAELLAGADPTTVFVDVVLEEEGRVVAENRAWFVPVKDLDLPEPRLDVQVSRIRNGYRIRLSSAAIARDVHLEAPGHEGSFSDDFFDVVPGRPVTIRFDAGGAVDPARFRQDLRVYSLRDAFVGRAW